MTLSTKAIFATLVLSLTPALTQAQSLPVATFAPIGAEAWTTTASGGIIGTPVQFHDCGATYMQHLLGQSVATVQASGVEARYFTPDSPFGTTDFQPGRLNISTDASYQVDRVYCG